MTPAEHYAEAELMLMEIEEIAAQPVHEDLMHLIARAQVHATLAAARPKGYPFEVNRAGLG